MVVLNEVIVIFIVITQLKGEDKRVCVVCVSGEGIEPTHHPGTKGEHVLNPVFRVRLH